MDDDHRAKIFTIAHLPPELTKLWLQHLRDFDVAHPGCHFEVGVDAPTVSVKEAVEMLKINPALAFATVLNRKATLFNRKRKNKVP